MARPKQNPTPTPQQATPKKRLSLNEFRAWLSGVEEMQPEDWTPNSSQWKTIRAKIEEVIEVPPQPRRVIEYDGGYDERPIRPAGPSAFMAPPQLMPQGPAPVPGADGKIKTPNIDTSKQPYVSSLE